MNEFEMLTKALERCGYVFEVRLDDDDGSIGVLLGTNWIDFNADGEMI